MTASSQLRFAYAACLTLGLAGISGCNVSAPPPQAGTSPAGYATRPYTPSGFALPSGGGCAGDVARFRAQMGNKYQTGNVNPGVYKRVSAEIDAADRACTGGNAAQAGAMIRATKARYGYP